MIDRNPAGLRDALFELMDGLRDGRVSRRDARAQCEVAKQIIETGRLEVMTVQAARQGLALAEAMERKKLEGRAPRELPSGDELEEA